MAKLIQKRPFCHPFGISFPPVLHIRVVYCLAEYRLMSPEFRGIGSGTPLSVPVSVGNEPPVKEGSVPVNDSDPGTVCTLGILQSSRECLSQATFEQLPVGAAVFDRDYRLRHCNSSWREMAACCAPSSEGDGDEGRSLFELMPGTEDQLMPALRRALSGETARCEGLRLYNGSVVSYWDVVWRPLVEQGEIIGIIGLSTNATERVRIYQELEQRVAERTRELSALYDVTTTASASLEPEVVMARSLERVLAAMECEIGTIHLLEPSGASLRLAVSRGLAEEVKSRVATVPAGTGLAGWTMERDQALIVPRIAEMQRPLLLLPALAERAYVGVPMHAGGRVLGVLGIVGAVGREFTDREVALLTSIADQVAVAVENAQLYQQAEQLATIRERQRLARELHDSVTQSLYSLVLVAEAGRRLADSDEPERVLEALIRLGEIGQQALKEMRLLVYELHPLSLQREGLVTAVQRRLEAVEKRAGIEAVLIVEGMPQLGTVAEEELYRVVQEALNNALKHAVASSVSVRVGSTGDRIEVEIVDNGRGFDPQAVRGKGGMGLASMRERVERLGGRLEILSSPGAGTVVRGVMSCQAVVDA